MPWEQKADTPSSPWRGWQEQEQEHQARTQAQAQARDRQRVNESESKGMGMGMGMRDSMDNLEFVDELVPVPLQQSVSPTFHINVGSFVNRNNPTGSMEFNSAFWYGLDGSTFRYCQVIPSGHVKRRA